MLQGRTEDEIYLNEKQRQGADPAAAALRRIGKVSGYQAPEEYELRKSLMLQRSRSATASQQQHQLHDSFASFGGGAGGSSQLSSSMLSLPGSQASSVTASQIAAAAAAVVDSEDTSAARMCAGIDVALLCSDHRQLQLSSGKRAPIQTPADGGGSTSKSNTKTGVLRENDQRQRSAQKLSAGGSGSGAVVFSGRDQKNVSPFRTASAAASVGGSSIGKLMLEAGVSANIMKAKRQISFDN